jgi:uncharacterized protein YacL
MSEAIDQLSDKMEKQNASLDDRIQKLERWHMLLIGAGLVIGFLVSRAADSVLRIIFPIK